MGCAEDSNRGLTKRMPMKKLSTLLTGISVAGAGLVLASHGAFAQEAVTPEAAEAAAAPGVPFIFNTLLFLIAGFLVMFMAAGFAMLEAGLVRTKNVSMQCLKNVAIYSVAGIMFWLIGYNVMYDGVDGGYFGSFTWTVIPDPASDSGDYAAASDWFFQMVFCATTASIVSGTIAERVKLWPFMIFVVFLTGVFYPITGSWQWGGGWLAEMGFSADGRGVAMPGSSIPLATLGMFILWLGWFGFNGGSQLAMGTIEDASAVARIFVNTNMAAAAGVVVVMVLTQIFYRKVDVTMALNGALAGLVSITAEPLAPSILMSVIIGGIGGAIVVLVVPLLDKIKVDDVVGAIPVHLVCGIWGTIAVPLTNSDASFGTQFIGIVAVGAFTFIVSLVLWLILKAVMGVRPTAEEEALGMDAVEIGVEAYPEFGAGSQRM